MIIEIFAAIVAILSIVKLLFILSKPKAWLKLVKPIYKHEAVTMIVSLVLSGIILYYLLQSGISIVQIYAVVLFVMALAAMTIAVYAKEFFAMGEKLVGDRKFLKKAWLPILIWLVLSVWVLAKIFA